MAKARKLTIGKAAFTTSGAAVTVLAQNGDAIVVKNNVFGNEFTVKLDEVYHSRKVAWGAMRAV